MYKIVGANADFSEMIRRSMVRAPGAYYHYSATGASDRAAELLALVTARPLNSY